MPPDTPFIADFRALLAKHHIKHPRFAHGMEEFDPLHPRVLYSGPVFDESEIVAAVGALVEGKWSVGGEYAHRFEREFSKYLGVAESVAVNSGSSADLIMVAAAKARYGWKDGDRVIVSPVGFPTSISAITLNGLVPVFVDIEWQTLNADNDAIAGVLERDKERVWKLCRDAFSGMPEINQIRAILVSPVLGNPPDIDRLLALRDQYGVTLLLDGCDSLGTTWRGKPLAQYFAASTCSLYPSHHISTLNGGMVSSDDREITRLARQMATWGRDCHCVGSGNLLPNGTCGHRFDCWLTSCPGVVVDHRYVYATDRAYNLQQIDLLAAMGLAQMEKIEHIHFRRRQAFSRIKHLGLIYLDEARTVTAYDAADPSWFGVPVICPDYGYKRALVAHLEAAGVQTRNYFAGSVLQHQGYAHLGRAADYPNAQQVLERVFFIGCAPFYTEAHFAHIESTLRSFQPPLAKAA